MTGQRVLENLNTALDAMLAADPRLYLLGEDIADPYGGAFKATRGLSTRYPDRVLSTPISEGAVVGVANGLALAGDKAIVEIMFGDFVALAFDQVVNFAAKSVSMYGRRVPMHVVVRCPTGAGRGYGPTHSQSMQKHFVGVPGLSVYEMTPFHDNHLVFAAMLGSGEPALHFEDKILYGHRMYGGDTVDDLFRFDVYGPAPGIARVYPDAPNADVDCALVATGGTAMRSLTAMRELLLADDITCRLVVPSRLYPLDATALLDCLAGADRVCVVEESTAGGTWGTEVAHTVHLHRWAALRGPVRLVHSADSVIPTATHLEQQMLVGAEAIRNAVREVVRD